MTEEQAKYNLGIRDVRQGSQELPRPVTPEERKLLDYFRDELQFGEAKVTVRRGLPVFVRVAFKDVKLD